ncbi:MAG: hypothetical protein KUG71_03835 [Porticoccaceae bacterium]|nr:hypothetical protein [Porticoccaceae bacterium]
MQIRSLTWLALATGLLPVVVVHISYVASALGGYVPWCNIYVDGCVSISASGRHGFSYVFFKLGMIPAAALLAAFWWQCRLWLRRLGDHSNGIEWAMVVCGLLSATFLVLYTVYLGSRGEIYQFMRRTGVIVYFSFSYLAQLLLLARLQRLRLCGVLVLPDYVLRGKMTLAVGLMVFGLVSIPVGNFIPDKDRLENIIEWWFALMMVSYYFFTWRAWCHTRLGVNSDK